MTDIIRTVAELREAAQSVHHTGRSIAFVPTMGNLHQGHLRLIQRGFREADICIASIFVNPMQFNDATDLAAYPRTPDQDLEKLVEAGVQFVFLPAVDTVYPRGIDEQTYLEVPGLGRILEGAHRPGHFRGVATVVNRLFNLVQPDVAIFGKKDYQQWVLIRRMVEDLGMPLRILAENTERETDGLAMSSRNSRLTPEHRRLAPRLYQALVSIRNFLTENPSNLERGLRNSSQGLVAGGFHMDYLTVRRQDDLLPPSKLEGELVILAAASLGPVRLIDNLEISLNRSA